MSSIAEIVILPLALVFTFRDVLVNLDFCPRSLLDHGDDFTTTTNDLTYTVDKQLQRSGVTGDLIYYFVFSSRK